MTRHPLVSPLCLLFDYGCVSAVPLLYSVWTKYTQLRGYDHEANMQGQCLLKAASHEVAAATALEQVLCVAPFVVNPDS